MPTETTSVVTTHVSVTKNLPPDDYGIVIELMDPHLVQNSRLLLILVLFTVRCRVFCLLVADAVVVFDALLPHNNENQGQT